MNEAVVSLHKPAFQVIRLVLSSDRIVQSLLDEGPLDSKLDPQLSIERLDRIGHLRDKFSEERWLETTGPTEPEHQKGVSFTDAELAAVRWALIQVTEVDLRDAYFGPGASKLDEDQEAHIEKLFADVGPAKKGFRVPTPIKPAH